VWQGYTKHGKTVGLNQVLLHAAVEYGAKSCVASMEIPGHRTLQNMGRQIMAQAKPTTEGEFNALIEWMDGFLWIYDCLGTANATGLLQTWEYVARKYGVRNFVADSLMKLDVDEEDNNAQKDLMNNLARFAVEFQAHVHLVAHSKKPTEKHPEEKGWPGKYHVRGSAHIVDLAHNTVCMWRNKKKATAILEADQTIARIVRKKQQAPMNADTENLDKILEDTRAKRATAETLHDAMFVVQAQRGGNGEEGFKRLWFDNEESWQFYEEDAEIVRYLPYTVSADEPRIEPAGGDDGNGRSEGAPGGHEEVGV